MHELKWNQHDIFCYVVYEMNLPNVKNILNIEFGFWPWCIRLAFVQLMVLLPLGNAGLSCLS